MKICVSSQGSTLDSEIDPRFGRCLYFIFADTDTLEVESIKNPNIDATGGAGIQSSQLMANKQVKAVITGKVGPNALDTLQAAGIEVITDIEGSVREAIEKFKEGKLKSAKGPRTFTESNKISLKTKEGFAMPVGRGLGRGMGMGRGRGMGRGAGPGGYCICPSCGEKVIHRPGVPCNTVDCPKCGIRMVRE